jgi:imidazole glycerol-phosphate synthase subunit HisH
MKSSTKVCVIDYKLGNLFSVQQALINTGLDTKVSSSVEDVKEADALVLPGVGAFSDAMKNLEELELLDPILKGVANGKPFFGICLGLQLLFTESEEFGLTRGLGLIEGRVTRFNNVNRDGETRKVPYIGWNQIFKPLQGSWVNTPLDQTLEKEFMYFVHSYYVDPSEKVDLTHSTYDGQNFVSSILKENIFACQFHPEKSGTNGLDIYKRWAEINNLK